MSGGLSSQMVDASIPLQAGKNTQPMQNPLTSLGEFATIQNQLNQAKLQQQALTSGTATVAQHLQQVGSNAMAPFLAIQNPTMTDLTNAAAYAEKIAGGTTQHVMQVAQNNPFSPNTPEWGGYMKRSIAALAQTDPATAVAQAAGTPVDQNNGLSINAGVRAPVTAGGGVTLSSSTPVFPTRSDQMARTPGPPGPQGQPSSVPIGPITPTSLTGLPMGTGRMRDTLPPGLQNPNAPAASPSGASASGRVMTGPDGRQWTVPANKVPLALQNGYH